ncbi:hypothetical protein Tco_0654389 [Tanacetum coccineum]|uniref:Integrase, catalytic region, zinc finger, CCHC-type, peptidase aspartic, catalytic n=1 Tax=Tanacetum coccineum TaxID=301880 RepID=A0ABQ4X3Z4_9ASTR
MTYGIEPGALHLGPERDRVFAVLTPEENDRFKADIRATNILLQGSKLTKDERESQLYDEFKHFCQNKGETTHEYYVRFTNLINDMQNIKMTMPKMQFNSKFVNNMLPEWGRFMTVVKLNRGLKTSNYDQFYAYLKQHKGRQNIGHGNYARGAVTAGNRGAQNRVGNTNPDQAKQIKCGQTNTFDDDVGEALSPTAQTMFMANLSSTDPIYDEIGPSYDSDILSEDNAVQVVQSNVSFVPNDALMMIINDMHEQAAQCVYANEQNKVVNESLTAEIARYKEKVKLYEKRTRRSHNVEKDFKQKENKYLEEFLEMKQLKEKVKDKLYKQDQSLQTVHMLCKPKPFYDERKKVAIGYKNPLYLTKAKQVLSALYNGHELVKTKHASAIVHDSEDTLEIAETTRMKMLEKSKSTMWVDSKIKIAPLDYSTENYLVTFTPQRQLTPEQIFWSSDIAKITLKPILSMMVYPPNTPARLVPGVLPIKNKMAEENVPAPTRTDEQLVPVKAHLPIRKSNLLMDLQRKQKNPIFLISLDIL